MSCEGYAVLSTALRLVLDRIDNLRGCLGARARAKLHDPNTDRRGGRRHCGKQSLDARTQRLAESRGLVERRLVVSTAKTSSPPRR